MKWIGAGLSGMACGTMAIQESAGAADWINQALPLLQLTAWLLFPGLAFLFMGMIGSGRTKQSKEQPNQKASFPRDSHSADYTVKFYRAVSMRKDV